MTNEIRKDINDYKGKYQSNYKLSTHAGLILVKNLTPRVTKQHLYEIFFSYGDIKSVINHKEGEYFIEFSNRKDAEEAFEYMNNAFLDGNNIEIVILV